MMADDPYADWHRLQRRIADEAMVDRLRQEFEKEKALKDKERKLAEKREQAFISLAKDRRGPMTVMYAQDLLREPPEFLRAEVEHVWWLARRHGVRMVTCAGPEDGLASRDVPLAAVPPFTNRSALGTALHEIAHLVNPCQPGHRRKRSNSGSSCCVRCELNAWVWARAHVYEGLWHREQQEDLRRGLGSYRSYATPAEKVEMDKLINAGPPPFAAQRLRLLEKCKS